MSIAFKRVLISVFTVSRRVLMEVRVESNLAGSCVDIFVSMKVLMSEEVELTLVSIFK